MARTRKPRAPRPKKCPPAVAGGIRTTADVEPIKRKAKDKPQARVKHTPIPNRRKKRAKKPPVDVFDELMNYAEPAEVKEIPKWTTKSVRLHNEAKERRAKNQAWVEATSKRLSAARKKLDKALETKRKRRPRRRVRDVDGGPSEAQQLPSQETGKETPGASSPGTQTRKAKGSPEQAST